MKTVEPLRYEIRVRGHLDVGHSEWLGNLELRTGFRRDQPVTVLSGSLADQSALHGVLTMIQSMGVTLLEILQLEELD
ncbi:hypothetical protein [Deinococcus altitudinis]|uniref:hypothetical protein n=1 Tax=Deinococcus altitudinis TaxID=468914 RepID=UPI003892AD46